jgi:hypothetical protein
VLVNVVLQSWSIHQLCTGVCLPELVPSLAAPAASNVASRRTEEGVSLADTGGFGDIMRRHSYAEAVTSTPAFQFGVGCREDVVARNDVLASCVAELYGAPSLHVVVLAGAGRPTLWSSADDDEDEDDADEEELAPRTPRAASMAIASCTMTIGHEAEKSRD